MNSGTVVDKLEKLREMRERAAYLASPFRKTGPSCFDEDVQKEVRRLRSEADRLDEEIFYTTAPVLQ